MTKVLVQAYQYFNWRRDSTNDLVLFVVINFSLLIMGSVIKVRADQAPLGSRPVSALGKLLVITGNHWPWVITGEQQLVALRLLDLRPGCCKNLLFCMFLGARWWAGTGPGSWSESGEAGL